MTNAVLEVIGSHDGHGVCIQNDPRAAGTCGTGRQSMGACEDSPYKEQEPGGSALIGRLRRAEALTRPAGKPAGNSHSQLAINDRSLKGRSGTPLRSVSSLGPAGRPLTLLALGSVP